MPSIIYSQEPRFGVRAALRRLGHLDGSAIDVRLSGLQRLRASASLEPRERRVNFRLSNLTNESTRLGMVVQVGHMDGDLLSSGKRHLDADRRGLPVQSLHSLRHAALRRALRGLCDRRVG